jgi:crotonobetainyl-CoA:carnitine CoA-transferase CaiB-like acyl-CoA transferase
MPVLPLDGVRVLDLSGEMGAYGTKLLADFGADVVKVEPPSGDRQRLRPPFAPGRAAPDGSLVFAYYNANKRGVTLPLDDPAVEPDLARLAVDRDLIVINTSGARVPGWDPVRKRLSWAGPEAVVCVLSNFGSGGPYDDRRATHFTSFAASGQMLALGPEQGPPRALPGFALYDELSAHAAAAMMAALRERPYVGSQVIELSLQDLLAYRDTVGLGVHFKGGGRMSTRSTPPAAPPMGIWDVRNGRVEVLVYNPPHWDGFLTMLGRPEALADPALRDRAVRAQRADELRPVIAELLRDRDLEELVDLAQQCRVPCAPQYTVYQLTRDRQLASRRFWVVQDGPGTGPFRVPGIPLRSTTTLLAQHRRPAPRLGEHNAELLPPAAALPDSVPRGAPVQAQRPPDSPVPAADGTGPRPAAVGTAPRLSQLRVLSFGTAIAGNVSATMLAEMGADVVKIESRSRPDPLRTGPIAPSLPRVFEPRGPETNVMFAGYSRSCRSVALDMKQPADQKVFTELVRRADVLIDNFATGVMAGWGLPHEVLAEINPRLIMVTVSGYGRTGPRAHYMAYGSTINAFMGLTRAWAPHGTQFDYTAVAHLLPAIFAALAYRDRTGSGSLIDIAQVEAGAAVLAPLYLPALNLDDRTEPAANSVPGAALSAVMACAGEDEWLAVELVDGADWNAVAGLLAADVQPVDDPASPPTGPQRDRLCDALARWAATRTALQAERALLGIGVAAARVRDTPDEAGDAQLWARGVFATVEHQDLGTLRYPQPFQRMSKTPLRIRRPSARLGEHTEDVLTEWLGEPADAPTPARSDA